MITRESAHGTAHIPPITTVVEPRDRPEVDRAGAGLYRAVHRERVSDVLRDLRERRVSAILLSTSRCLGDQLTRTMRVVRDFPGIPAFILLSHHAQTTPEDVLMMGNCGVRHVVDVRSEAGWTTLRHSIAATAGEERDEAAIQRILDDIGDGEMTGFITSLFAGYTSPRTVRQLAASLGVLPSTLVSRFYRAGVPAPKRFLAYAGLVRAARMLENPGLSIADVANHLGHSSPQSFARHIKTYVGKAAGDFRREYTGQSMLARFRDELILPYREELRTLSPVLRRPRGSGARKAGLVA